MSFTDEFRRESHIIYPPFSKMYFEKYFYRYIEKLYSEKKITQELYERYIPVFWTELQFLHQYIKHHLQSAIDKLSKGKSYFTVVQHDDGICLINMPNNVVVFGMGGVGDIPLPLTYDNKELFENYKNNTKTVFCSFVGSLTHPCRERMISVMNEPDVVLITTDIWTFRIETEKQELFLDTTSKSRFTLAPRGYGKTSFRMYEALRLSSIPVYIYDDEWLPYKEVLDWSKLAVLVHIDDIDTLYNRLKEITDDQITEMLNYYHSVEHYFTYDGMCEYILNNNTII